jgi:aminoglycoside phosphotransferase (APT) family kinase protein
MPRQVYFQREASDPVLPEETVLTLVRRHVPRAQAVLSVDESGGEARTYAVDDAVIVKVQRPQQLRTRTSLEREVVFLRHLAAVAPDLPVPRVLGYGREGPALEYTVLGRIPGVAMRRAGLAAPAAGGVLVDLGRLMRRIHGVPQAPLQECGLFPGDRGLPDIQMRIAESFWAIGERLQQQGRGWEFPLSLERMAILAAEGVPRGEPLVGLHSNPGPEHTFVDPQSGRFSGLIDFGDAYISHPAFDLRRWAGAAHREHLFAGYTAEGPVGPGFTAVWHAVQMLSAAATAAAGGADAAAAAEDLHRLLAAARSGP